MPLPRKLKLRAQLFASKYLPFLKVQPPEMDRQGALTLRPGRNSQLTWEKQAEGKTMLTVPMSQKAGKLTKALAKWLRERSLRPRDLLQVPG